jgi:hypothetical protein
MVQLRVELAAHEDHDRDDVHPAKKHHDCSNGAVCLVGWKVLDVESEEQRGDYEQESCHH